MNAVQKRTLNKRRFLTVDQEALLKKLIEAGGSIPLPDLSTAERGCGTKLRRNEYTRWTKPRHCWADRRLRSIENQDGQTLEITQLGRDVYEDYGEV